MSGVLTTLLSLSVSGTLVILVLWGLQKPIGKRMGASWRYYLWLIAVLRLLLPFTPPDSPVGLLFDHAETTFQAQVPTPETSVFEEVAAVSAPMPAAAKEEPPGLVLQDYLWLAWLLPAAMLLVRRVTSDRGFVQYAKAGCSDLQSPKVLNLYAEVCESLGLRHPPSLYVNPMLSSPMLIGGLRPFLTVPSEELPPEELRMIFLHELTHFRHLDFLYKETVQLAVCLHWFNPAVYWMRQEIWRSCELSCDERVVRRLEDSERKLYGNTLLSSLRLDGYHNASASASLTGDGKQLKERLESIMRFKKKSRLTAVFSATLSLMLVLGAVTTGAYLPASLSAMPETVSSLTKKAANLASSSSIMILDQWDEKDNSKEQKEESDEFWGDKEFYRLEGRSRFQYDYQHSYIMGFGWNADFKKYDTFAQIGNYRVAFAAKTKPYVGNTGLLKAMSLALEEQAAKSKNSSFWLALESPVLLEVSGPYSDTPTDLANRFYRERNLAYFSAVCKDIPENETKALAVRAIQDDEIAYFSVLDLSEQDSAAYAEKSYQENKINFFTVCDLSAADSAKYAERAYKDNKIDFFSVCDLSAADYAKYAERAYKDNKIDFFSVCDLSAADYAKYAERAYKDNKIDFFSVCDLSAANYAKYAERAYKDDKINFFSVCDLSSADYAKYAERAYKDDKINFFSICDLSPADSAKYAERAYKDDKIDFFTVCDISQADSAKFAERAYQDDRIEFLMVLD